MIAEELRVVVTAEVDKAVKGLETTQKQSKNTAVELTKLVAKWASVGAAIALAKKVINDSLVAWAELETAMNHVASALEVTGQNVEVIMPRMDALAREIQRATTVSDGAAYTMMALATSMGVAARDVDSVVKGAVGLSRVFGMDANTAIRAVTNALEGNFGMLERYVPQIRTAKDETEKMAALQLVMAQSFEVAKRETETLAGAQEQYKNAMSDTKEALGEALAGPLQGYLRWITDVLNKTTDARTAMRDYKAMVDNLADGETNLESLGSVLSGLILKRDELEKQKPTMFYPKEILEQDLKAANDAVIATQALIATHYDEMEARKKRDAAATEAAVKAREQAAAEALAAQARVDGMTRLRVLEREALLASMTENEKRLLLLQEEQDIWAALRKEVAEALGIQSWEYRELQPVIMELEDQINALKEAMKEAADVEEQARLNAELERQKALLEKQNAELDKQAQITAVLFEAKKAYQDAEFERTLRQIDAEVELFEIERKRRVEAIEAAEKTRDEWTQMHVDRIDQIREQRDAFVAAGVDEVEVNKWATREIINEYATRAQEVMAVISQLGGMFMSVWQEAARAQEMEGQNEIAGIREALKEREKASRAKLDMLRAEQNAMKNRHDLEIAFAEAAGATDQELAEIRLQHVQQRIAAEEHAAAEEQRIADEREAAEAEAKERESVLRKKAFEEEKKMRIAQTIMAGAQAFVNTLASVPFPWNIAAGLGIAALTAGQVSMIHSQQAPAFERGGSFVTNGPQTIQVGDGQSPRERVTVEPLSGPYARRSGGDIHVHVHAVAGSDRATISAWIYEGIQKARQRGLVA